MYLHIYKCKNCKAFGTKDCTWKGTKEDNIACENFEHITPTISTTGTVPISGFVLDIQNTCISASGPIEITTKTE